MCLVGFGFVWGLVFVVCRFGVFCAFVCFLIGVPFFECLLFIYAFNVLQALIEVEHEMEMDQDLKLSAASLH